jgi:Tfp pilus assembly protein PilF
MTKELERIRMITMKTKTTWILSALFFLLTLNVLSSCADRQEALDKARLQYDIAFDLLQKGESSAAVVQVNKAIELDPKNASYHNLLGLIYMNRGMLDNAEKSFREALRFKSDYADVNNNLCGLYITKNMWDEAIKECKVAIESISYSSPEKAYLNMGWAYYKKSDFMNAIDAYNKALMHRRDFYLAHQNLGTVYADLGKYNLAIEHFKKAVDGCNFCPEPFYRLGLALFKVDRKPTALKSFQKCKELDKDGEIGKLCSNFLEKYSAKPAKR